MYPFHWYKILNYFPRPLCDGLSLRKRGVCGSIRSAFGKWFLNAVLFKIRRWWYAFDAYFVELLLLVRMHLSNVTLEIVAFGTNHSTHTYSHVATIHRLRPSRNWLDQFDYGLDKKIVLIGTSPNNLEDVCIFLAWMKRRNLYKRLAKLLVGYVRKPRTKMKNPPEVVCIAKAKCPNTCTMKVAKQWWKVPSCLSLGSPCQIYEIEQKPTKVRCE